MKSTRCDDKKQAFPFHSPLVFSFFAAVFLVGFIIYPTRIRPAHWAVNVPDSILRYLGDDICLFIFGVFCLTLFYGCFQFLGLRAHKTLMADVHHSVATGAEPFSSRAFKNSRFRIEIVHILTGRDKSAYFHLFDVLRDRLGRPDLEADSFKLCRDMIDDHRIRLIGDLYVMNYGIWVLPILGFIGTVWGISHSVVGLKELVSGTSSNPQLILDLPASMSKVLAGLSTAFDTTFLGLVFAAVVMLPAMMLRRAIDRRLMNDYKTLVRVPPWPENESKQNVNGSPTESGGVDER